MIELGGLNKRTEDFAKQGVRIIAVSNDDQTKAQETKVKLPNLLIVSDRDQNLAKAVQVLHPRAAPDGSDTNAPTTFLIDGDGYVRWMYRPDRIFDRLSADELLQAINQTWPTK